MKITASGRVTVPAEVRERAGFSPNTDVEFVFEGNKVVLRKAKRKKANDVRRILDAMRGKGTGKLTTDEIMRLTRGE
jgi:AbrB family looped-hinge helix DNA binding protein